MMPATQSAATPEKDAGKQVGVTLRLPTAFQALFPEASPRVQVAATTVKEAIDALDERWPGMRDRLCDSRPAIRRHINIFVNGERVSLNAPLEAGCEVFILTAISGG